MSDQGASLSKVAQGLVKVISCLILPQSWLSALWPLPGTKKDTGSAVRQYFSCQDQFWTLIHGQEGEGELEPE